MRKTLFQWLVVWIVMAPLAGQTNPILIAHEHPMADTATVKINDLSDFREVSPTWSIVGKVSADLVVKNKLTVEAGSGIIVNQVSEGLHGKDIVTKQEFGDMHLQLEYLLSKDGNSGIYLQGQYEIQLLDSWEKLQPKPGDNGGLYNRWDESLPDGRKGYDGRSPRWNVSKAPGLWQKIDIVFRAPKFDDNGQRIQQAVLESVHLNGVLIHDHVYMTGPTRGSMSEKESPLGPLRIQGDHGSLALRNITIQPLVKEEAKEQKKGKNPIFLQAESNTTLRSFMDIEEDYRVTRSVSVGSPLNVHYSYDLDVGNIFQVWRGAFLNTTPMWNSRGDGSSRPQGVVTSFGYPMLGVSELKDMSSEWPQDTLGTGYRPRGYSMTAADIPIFQYDIFDNKVYDFTHPTDNGRGLVREVRTEGPNTNLYHLAAVSESITPVSETLYVIGDQSYYVEFETAESGKIIQSQGKYFLVLPLKEKVEYTIWF